MLALVLSQNMPFEEVRVGDQSSNFEQKAELLDWCGRVKQELGHQRIFDTEAAFVSDVIDTKDIGFADFESIQVPYIVDKPFTISVERGVYGSPRLRIVYESGLTVFAAPILPDPICDIFDWILPELPSGLRGYVFQRYGSTEEFTRQIFGGVPDYAQLRFEGYAFTTEDIDCTEGFEETVRKVTLIMASASPNLLALSGKDVAYWSQNSNPGIVIRQEVPTARGDFGPRIHWLGKFFGDDEIWQVLISFNMADKERYDRLGPLLANPGLSQ